MASNDSEPFGPANESLVALGGRRHPRFAQAPAQLVEGYRYVEVEVRVHAQDYLDIRTLRVSYAAHHHVSCAPFGAAVTTAGPMIRRTDDTVTSLVFGTLP